MGKVSSSENRSLRQLRTLAGLKSMVEIREDGVVAARRGAPNEDLVDATPNFIRIGKMLGRSLEMDDLIELRVVGEGEGVTFAQSGDRRVGIIHASDQARLLDVGYGA